MITTIAAMILIILCINGYQISWWLIFAICGVSLIAEISQSATIALQKKKIDKLAQSAINLLVSLAGLTVSAGMREGLEAGKKKEEEQDDHK